MAGQSLIPAKRAGRAGVIAPPVRPLRGMFGGNSPAELDASISAVGVDVPLGHQFLDAAKWTDVANPYGHTEWGLWPYDPSNPQGTAGTDPRFIRKLARWHRVYGYQHEIYNNVLTDGHDHRLATYPDSLAAYQEIATSSAWLPDDKA